VQTVDTSCSAISPECHATAPNRKEGTETAIIVVFLLKSEGYWFENRKIYTAKEGQYVYEALLGS
jgi:hypothetical protein